MKLSILLLLVTFFSLKANDSYAQRTKISVNLHNIPVGQLIDEIESSTEFQFVYKIEDVDLTRTVSVNADNKRIEAILNQVFGNTQTTFNLNDRRIYLVRRRGTPIPDPLKVETIHPVLQFMINGTIKDQDGNPLPGANVVEKGTTNGVTADFDGNFSIGVVDDNAVLLVSYIGFGTKEVPIDGQSSVDIILEEAAAGLDEVVVVGYGTVKKSDITGSVTSVSNEQLAQVQVPSLENALQGRAAGVNVTQTSGAPGGVNRIRIRGGNSLSAGNEPLYVIDGFPIYNNNGDIDAGSTRSESVNALATLNPGDIESVEILKDASATAIYGSRGANGVILVTTKRGKSGKSTIELDISSGIQTVINTIDVLNAREFAEFQNEVYTYDRDILGQNMVPEFTPEQIEAFGEGTNWQDEIFRTAPVHNYQLTATGGNEGLRYSVVGSYTDQEGVVLGTDFDRISLRINLDANINDRLTLGTSSVLSRTHTNLAYTGAAGGFQGQGSGITATAISFNPTTPVRDENGEFTFQDRNEGEVEGARNASVGYYNPVALATLSTNESTTFRVLSNTYGEYKILDNLTFRTTIGGDFTSTEQNSYFPSTIRLAAGVGGEARKGSINSFTWLNENTLNYTKQFDKSSLDFLMGATYQSSRTESFNVTDRGFVNDVLGVNNIGSGENSPALFQPNVNEWGLISYLGRMNYSLNRKYLFTLTSRYDGSSRFGDDNKWGFFPSGAVAWRISQENFLKDSKAVSNLKLRASYGLTGNQEIGLFRSLNGLGNVRYVLGDQQVNGFSLNRIANPNLKWETTKQTDIGIDLGLFNGRVNLTADYYDKVTEDLLLDVQIPSTSGFSSSLQNVGRISNRGFELAVDALVINQEVKLDVGFNIATNRNEVLDLGDETQRFITPSWNVLKGQPASILEVGQPVGQFFGYETDGIFFTDEEAAAALDQSVADQSNLQLGGNTRYVDTNGDGVIDVDDRTVIGNALPDFTGGFSTNLSYKGIELSTTWAFSVGNDIANLQRVENSFGIDRYNSFGDFVNRWSYLNSEEQNRRATQPTVRDGKNLFSVIDTYIEDGSFLRMRDVTLSYNIPVSKLGKTALSSLRVYFSGQNLLTFTNYTGFDPEVNVAGQDNLLLGFDYSAYPIARMIMVGLNAKF